MLDLRSGIREKKKTIELPDFLWHTILLTKTDFKHAKQNWKNIFLY